jgi:imidazolonepropionase-like amidohydrolase
MATGERWIAGGRLAGGDEVALRVEGGRVLANARRVPASSKIETIDLRGHWIAPFAIDSHVHLAFAASLGASDADNPALVTARLSLTADLMTARGVCAAIDLGAPRALMPALEKLGTQTNLTGPTSQSRGLPARRFSLAQSGPLLCAPHGYPTQSWGQDGYGLAVSTPDEARAAVAGLHKEGAGFAKLALDARFPVLAPEVAKAVVAEAKKLGMRSAAHALDVAAVKKALEAGVEILAHTPVEPLSEALIKECGARKLTVLSTLHAFGGTKAARENLARLAHAGCHAIYGTDLGNQDTLPGILAPELHELSECGFSGAQILAMCTQDAAALLGDATLGSLKVGSRAHFLVLAEDPTRDPTALTRPAARYFDGAPLATNGPGSP